MMWTMVGLALHSRPDCGAPLGMRGRRRVLYRPVEMNLDYLPIQNADLASDIELTFDLYLSLPLNRRVVLYRRQGDVLEIDRLAKFANSENSNLVIRRADYAKFVTFVSDRLKNLLEITPSSNNRLVFDKAIQGLLRGTFEHKEAAVVRSMMDNLNDVSSVVIDSVMSEISENGRKTYRNLVNLASTGTDFQKHPVNVASLAVMISLGSGYSSKRTVADVSMAALLHDLGLAKLPGELALQAHRKDSYSLDEKLKIDNHVEHSLEIIKDRRIEISALTKTMIEQHHEQFNGSGFPKKLRGLQVSPFAQILSMADEIDQQVFGAETGQQVNQSLRNLFEVWSRDKTFEPRLLQRVRGLFFTH